MVLIYRGSQFTWFCFAVLMLFGTLEVDAQSLQKRSSYRIGFYNVENYFDTVNNPDKSDEEFTPDGFKHWNFYRYKDKQTKIAKTIIAMGQWKPPAIVGLAEVENAEVLRDLLTFSPISDFGYKIIHKQSPDWRGIDVALLYRQQTFKPIDTQFIEVNFKEDEYSATRDILYIKGIASGEDTLHIFMNHWPSRYGGKAETDPKRAKAALTVRKKVDSIFRLNADAKIVITGDFNDEPSNKSLKKTLGAKGIEEFGKGDQSLINLMSNIAGEDQKGSYKYKYQWNTFDQFIVSSPLLSCQSGLCARKSSAHIFRSDFLLTEDDNYPGLKPFRTYLGPRYKGGYSDHLPVYLDLFPASESNRNQ